MTSRPQPEDFARALLSRLEIQQPVNLERVASAIRLRIRKVNSTGFDGAMKRLPGRALGIVAVRAAIRGVGRERFTIAHEIGHYVLPGHGTLSSICTAHEITVQIKNNTEEEIAANRFATELLLPAEQIHDLIRERALSIGTVRFIADRFQTSLTAAVLQCVAVTDQTCAVVVSVAGIVRYYRSSKSWAYFIPVGCALDKHSLAARLDLLESEATGVVNIFAWAPMGRIDSRAEVLENSIYLPPHNMVLTILTAIPI